MEKGGQGVRIELMLPQEQVLLSSFDGWHAVLNNHFLSLTDEEYEQHASMETALSANALKRAKQKSWRRIFDLSLLPDPAVYEVQAVFWRLEMAAVTKVDYFTAR